MRRRHYLMAAGLAIAAWLAIFGDKTPGGKVAEPVVRAAAARAGVAAQGATTLAVSASASVAATPNTNVSSHNGKLKPESEPLILELRAREELIGGVSAGNKIDGLFGTQSWAPPPPPPSKQAPSPPPAAPAVPFAYIGKKVEDTVWEVYLKRGENTFNVRENSVIEGKYRIDSIKPPTLTLTYLPLKQVQTLTIEGTD
jgi:hypothetical protein